MGGTAKDLHPSVTFPRVPSGRNFIHFHQSKIHIPLKETPESHEIRDGTMPKVQHLTTGLFFFCQPLSVAWPQHYFGIDTCTPLWGLISFNLLMQSKPCLYLLASHHNSFIIHDSVGQ